jgi:hypothetical protein
MPPSSERVQRVSVRVVRSQLQASPALVALEWLSPSRLPSGENPRPVMTPAGSSGCQPVLVGKSSTVSFEKPSSLTT